VIKELLNKGEVVCLFPEGTISRNGHLTEFKRGYEKSAKAANDDVVIIPFYLRGLWGSQFSRSSEHLKNNKPAGMRRDILVAFGTSLDKNTDAEVLKRRVFDLSIQAWQRFTQDMPTISEAWINTVKRDSSALAIADTLTGSVSAARALTGARLLSKRINKVTKHQNVGLLLPTGSGGVLANMATLMAGKTIVNLNYTASEDAIRSAIEQADLATVVSSKRFLDKLQKRGIDLSGVLGDVNVVDIEEMLSDVSTFEKLGTLLCVKCLPAAILKPLFNKRVLPSSTAAILFSSGSEGQPKGVELSHQNILANLKQVAEVLNAESNDVVMASLPLFHAFGLTVTQFMPLIEGMPMVCHADPTDSFGVAKAVAKFRATIMCGTSTFLRFYTRDKKVNPLMFESLRIVVSGAEKLNEDVREAFKLKFGKNIFEGYGATETSPVASVNLPDVLDMNSWKVQPGSKKGSVGMPLPGTSFKIVDPDSLEELPTGEQGMILIGGPQVMQGYLGNLEKTQQALVHSDGVRWYVSGDKGYLDDDGFLTIVDRYSRFAKIGGEMVSLSEVETQISNCVRSSGLAEDIELMAVNVPDEKKGEKIIVLGNQAINESELRSVLIENKVSALAIPSKYIYLEALPKLGSGKADFSQAKQIATTS